MNLSGLKERAASGSCSAQAILGLYYLYGAEDVAVDYSEAQRLLSEAASRGSSRAALNLADMYALGLGVTRDVEKAVELYEQVGRVEFFAALALGRLYSEGRDAGLDHGRALQWYRIASGFEGRIADCDELREALSYVQAASG